MTDKPVLLVKDADEEYRLLILEEILKKKLPKWDEEYFSLVVCDETLTSFWGDAQIAYTGYRYRCFYMENSQLAKEFAALVQRTLLAFDTGEAPKPEALSGLLDF